MSNILIFENQFLRFRAHLLAIAFMGSFFGQGIHGRPAGGHLPKPSFELLLYSWKLVPCQPQLANKHDEKFYPMSFGCREIAKKQCVQSISGHPVYVTKHAYINIYNENTIGLYGLQHFCRNLDSGSTKPIFQKHVRNFLSKVCLGPSLEDRKYQFCHAAAKKCCGSGNLLIYVQHFAVFFILSLYKQQLSILSYSPLCMLLSLVMLPWPAITTLYGGIVVHNRLLAFNA